MEHTIYTMRFEKTLWKLLTNACFDLNASSFSDIDETSTRWKWKWHSYCRRRCRCITKRQSHFIPWESFFQTINMIFFVCRHWLQCCSKKVNLEIERYNISQQNWRKIQYYIFLYFILSLKKYIFTDTDHIRSQ